MSILVVVCVSAALLFGPSPPAPPGYAAYMKERAALLESEQAEWCGGGLQTLSAVEVKADQVLRAARALDEANSGSLPPLPSVHFFDAKPRIEKSAVYPLLQAMPKGAALHVRMIRPQSLIGRGTTHSGGTVKPNCPVLRCSVLTYCICRQLLWFPFSN